MTRLITMAEIREHYRMRDCIDALETMFEELGRGRAITDSREDILAYLEDPPAGAVDPVYYDLKTMGGVIPKLGVGAVRLNSYVRHHPSRDGEQIREKFPAADGRLVGLVLLFSSQTGEPLAIFPDRIVQSYRVGATNALGAKYLAREDATRLGLYGAGWQARSHLLALSSVRDLATVTVYAPTPESREEFAEEMSDLVSADIRPVDDPREVPRGADILQCTTSSLSPVFEFDWVDPGTHVAVVSDREAPPEFFDIDAYDAFVQSWSSVTQIEELGGQITERVIPTKNINNYVIEGEEPLPKLADRDEKSEPPCDWTAVPGLGEVVVDADVGRSNPDGLTGFYNRGMGVQFAAAGKALLDVAEQEDLGHDIATELLTEDPRPELPSF